jgi:hypothetical protein
MKPSDVFGICVRVIGLLGVLIGAGYVFAALCSALLGQGVQTGQDLLYGLFFSAVGTYLLKGAPHCIRLAYPNESAKDPTR